LKTNPFEIQSVLLGRPPECRWSSLDVHDVSLACGPILDPVSTFFADARRMYLSKHASQARLREAENARRNRAEIVKALSVGQIGRRDLFKWGLFTAAGVLADKHGLSPFAQSAFGAVPTGTPSSPLFGLQKFKFPLVRLDVQKPHALIPTADGNLSWGPLAPYEPDAKRLSYHADYSALPPGLTNPFRNPLTNRGPMEGRPPGEVYAHQRWSDYFPKAGYIMSVGPQRPDTTRFHPELPAQDSNSIWSFGAGSYRSSANHAHVYGTLPPPLIKARYGEPMITRVYNNLLNDAAKNNGFGRNETSLHLHNAHNGGESDGASNAFHFPGTFYDYRWGTTLARRDTINTDASDARASGPDGSGGLTHVPGDYRELQGSMWFHDHRFFFTAENVYKGMAGCINYYSGPDRGNEAIKDGVNLCLPSGSLLDWGNVDFDVNLMVSDAATDKHGQLFFDIFDTDGFIGDIVLINGQVAPFFEVLPRKYRFRLLNASMARFYMLVLANAGGKAVPFQFIANDGNLVVNPVPLTSLDEQGPGERYDIVVDFSQFRPGDKVQFVNVLQQFDGRKPKGPVPLSTALSGKSGDPAVGPVLEFRVVSSVASVDRPGITHSAAGAANALPVAAKLTDYIPIIKPARERVFEWGRGGGSNSRDPVTGRCTPDCSPEAVFPWSIKVDGESPHTFNANRISALIPKPGDVEHWTFVNGGGGWDHPVHLHFEEGVTIDRGNGYIGPAEKFARKDVWRLRPSGQVKIQVKFSDFGGAYVSHCHNTAHEDFAMMLRFQVIGNAGTPQAVITQTPNPTLDGVTFTTPEYMNGSYSKS
jgi:FtsP/CotA-like multicopper oxidase with cupredoxin domain